MQNKFLIILISLFFSLSPSFAQAKDNGKFRFAVLGCMHLGLCDYKDYELTVRKIKEYNPDFVLFLGGMIDPLADKSPESLWQEFNRITAKLGVPTYNIPSNCRMMNLSVPRNRMADMERCFLSRYKKHYYSFEYKNNLFIGLDSASPDLFDQEKDMVMGEQLDFLNKTLSDFSRYNNIFILMSHSPWFKDNNKWFKTTHPLIRGKVKYVFGASLHLLDQEEVDHVNYITTGTPPYGLDPSLKASFLHFLIVDVDKEEVSINIMPVKNPIPINKLGDSREEIRIYPQYLIAQMMFKSKVLSTPEREIILQPDRVVQTLKIKPEMDILDIGAGTGLFTFRFAEALRKTGRVFATDVDQSMIDYIEHIKRKTEDGKYKNVAPVLVKPEGVDPFYKHHSFDLIFISGVYDSILHPEDYFRQLRPSLKKTGRLYIIHFKNVSDFSEVEFEDFKKVIKILVSNGEDFPIFKRLDKEVQGYIRSYEYGDIPFEIRTKIIHDFNNILLDRRLYNDLSEYYSTQKEPGKTLYFNDFVDPLDIRLAFWLIVSLDEKRVFDKEPIVLNETAARELKRLNRLLLTGIFQTDKLYWITTRRVAVEKNSVILTMEEAGYQFIRDYSFLPYHYFLEFKRKF